MVALVGGVLVLVAFVGGALVEVAFVGGVPVVVGTELPVVVSGCPVVVPFVVVVLGEVVVGDVVVLLVLQPTISG